MIPTATYRLQLNKDFTFAHAEALVPYLHDLGISHAYLSPILMARPGSTHGYDTVDHTRINPELGTIDDFRALARALRKHDMGIILDFVPNHMGVGGAHNALWLDVLKFGPSSRYADWFDIDWHSARPGMDGKLLVPFLGASYAECLAAGDLLLGADRDGFAVWAYGTEKLPLRQEDAQALTAQYDTAEHAIAAHTGVSGQLETWARLDALIARQHWRLAHFSVASGEINYRRFFINSDLAGIRIDRPEVFDHAHGLIFALVEEGLVDGLRIDHVDGLLDPKAYLEALREKTPRPLYLVVEKILAPHEQLRRDWPVDGTTGYEVGADLTRLLMQPQAEAALTSAYETFVGPVTAPEQEAYHCKLRVMENELYAELAALAQRLANLAWTAAATADLTEVNIRHALREIIAHLAVYRTYKDENGASERDHREIRRAIALARSSQPQIEPSVFAFVEAVLCGGLGVNYEAAAISAALGRFQQYTGPVMAKGLEDTALYRYNRLVALNEVGAHPDRFAISVAAFHDSNRRRLACHPLSMVATSTHDTKRGEDTRAVIAAIADAPALWASAVAEWRAMLAIDGADVIHPNDLYLFLQLLWGGWPLAGEPEGLAKRLQGAMQKSLREARLRSDWGVNNERYEAEISDFVERALGNAGFMSSFRSRSAPLREIGRRKALIQAALKLTIPGIPDIYRGAESWEQSFVDPDNRRTLDFADLAQSLKAPRPDRDEKLVLTQSLLLLRRRRPALFATGTYEPLDCGPGILAFRRQHESQRLVVLADLSVGHSGTLPEIAAMPTIFGSPHGPVWLLLED